eukprot:8543943-Pyramimonas_sp.AAC.1
MAFVSLHSFSGPAKASAIQCSRGGVRGTPHYYSIVKQVKQPADSRVAAPHTQSSAKRGKRCQ